MLASSKLNLCIDQPLDGKLDIVDWVTGDRFAQRQSPGRIRHDGLVKGGGVETVVDDRSDKSTRVLATVSQDGHARDVLVARNRSGWNGGKVVYFRGTNSNRYVGGRLLTPDNPEQFFHGPLLMRYVLSEFGYTFLNDRLRPATNSPVVCVARSNNGYFFSRYTPDTTVKQRFRFRRERPCCWDTRRSCLTAARPITCLADGTANAACSSPSRPTAESASTNDIPASETLCDGYQVADVTGRLTIAW